MNLMRRRFLYFVSNNASSKEQIMDSPCAKVVTPPFVSRLVLPAPVWAVGFCLFIAKGICHI